MWKLSLPQNPQATLILRAFLFGRLVSCVEVILALFRKSCLPLNFQLVLIFSQAEQIKQTEVEIQHVTAPRVFSRNYAVLSTCI